MITKGGEFMFVFFPFLLSEPMSEFGGASLFMDCGFMPKG